MFQPLSNSKSGAAHDFRELSESKWVLGKKAAWAGFSGSVVQHVQFATAER